MRLFIAVDLDAAAREAIGAEQKRLGAAIRQGEGSNLKWVRPEQIHLTLMFLGEVKEATAHSVVAAMQQPIAQPPFDLEFAGAGVFPPRGAPNVLWIGVTGGAREVVEQQCELARRVGELGIAIEQRPFHPHLTLARWRASRPSDRGRVLSAARDGLIARVHVDHAALYWSHLSAAGPTYTPLARATLTP
jgi:2'-5' RNA ligase